MGFRFRKSISLGKGQRLNVSKRGLGVSGGMKGFRVGVGPRGVRRTTSIPGTGISFVEEKSFKSMGKSRANYPKTNEVDPASIDIPTQKSTGTGWVWGTVVGIVLLFANPMAGIPLLGVSIYFLAKNSKKPINKSAKEFNLGVANLKKSDLKKAKNHLESSLEYNPDNELASLMLLYIYYQQEEYNKAIENASKIESYLTDDPSLTYIVASCYFETQKYDDAISLLQRINSVEDFKDQANILLGRCFMEKDMLEIAVEQFKKGPVLKRKMTPMVMEAKYWLGLAYYKLGDKKRALNQFQKVYAEDIEFRDVKNYI